MQSVKNEEIDISITVQVVEAREVVNDSGTQTQKYLVKPVHGRQTLPLKVAVRENLGFGRMGKVGTFVFTFQAEHFGFGHTGVRYAVATEKGWLLVVAEDNNEFSIPQGLKVQVTRITEEREFFTVLEGPLRGQRGSAKFREGISSFSPGPVEREPPIEMVYRKKSRLLTIPGLGEFKVARPPRNPYPVGQVFHVAIPDFPHEGGQKYEKVSAFATTWFGIPDQKVPERYLHTGKVSVGCATVTAEQRWDEIYQFLINRRVDDKSVATLRVENT